MFRIAGLSQITFVGSESETTLDLTRSAGRIRQIGELIAQSVPLGGVVGLIFPTGPELVLAWLGALAAECVPLILQYPNEKAGKAFWKESLGHAVEQCGIAALVCAPDLAAYSPEELALTFFPRELAGFDEGVADLSFPDSGEILQMSSGTTGFKKPIRFTFEALRNHTARYNEVLGLNDEDRVVSWLPLYHDMGFIACFVMPLMLGVPIVMIDPITWVRQPDLLSQAIERHRGTVCYMPNFGFEVMAKSAKPFGISCVRRWISCSEPTYPATLQRFIEATGAAPEIISTCYAMAENVFAVTLSAGMHLLERDGRQYVSCGRPIPGTEVKLVEGELLVRSSHSLAGYVGTNDIRDQDGFYATGDIGFVEDGEIVVTGRKQDVANIAGRKYLLNDLDFSLGKLFPQSAGRIASISVFDEAGGTEKALFLVEMDNFWEWERSSEPARLIREATGVEWMEVHFVPRQFITKTSSGKINRGKTLADWTACQSDTRVQRVAHTEADHAEELAELFPGVPRNRPVKEELDSLGLLMLRMFCEQHGLAYTADLTLEAIVAERRTTGEEPKTEVFSIVALVDGWRLGFDAPEPFIDQPFLEAIAKVVGRPVHIEHICVPPALILFSDLIFHDYFLPRNPDPAYDVVSSLMRKIKGASLILVDDEDNFRTPPYCAYPVLDRLFTMAADADLLGHRMQRYTRNHHLLPRRVVLGRDIPAESVNPVLTFMESYLEVPMLKMAFHAEFRRHTEGWDFCDYKSFGTDADKIENRAWLGRFREVLLEFIRQRPGQFRMRPGEAENRFVLVDSPHFCSFLLNRAAVDFVVERYGSFCLVGLPSSLPYLQERLAELGKPYFFSSETTPDRDDYECLVLTGGVGGRMPVTDRPTYDFVHAREEGHGGGRPHNVSEAMERMCPPLAACNEQIFRTLVSTHGVLIGNYLLNHTKEAATVPAGSV